MCSRHYWKGDGWHREVVERPDGTSFNYIVKDAIAEGNFSGLLVDPSKFVRVVERLKEGVYSAGRCPCCMDPFTTTVSVIIEHTTWGKLDTAFVCSLCAEDPMWRVRAIEADNEARRQRREAGLPMDLMPPETDELESSL